MSRLPNKEKIDGKEVFSVLLPEDFNFIGKDKSGNDVHIVNGVLKTGFMDKANLGQESGLMLRNIYEKYGLKSAFIGIDDSRSLPNTDYIYDFRKKLIFTQTTQLMKHSMAYIGNDTGPMHLANLIKKPTLGIYSRETSMTTTYYPIFNNLNTQVLGFPPMDFVDNFCSKLVEKA